MSVEKTTLDSFEVHIERVNCSCLEAVVISSLVWKRVVGRFAEGPTKVATASWSGFSKGDLGGEDEENDEAPALVVRAGSGRSLLVSERERGRHSERDAGPDPAPGVERRERENALQADLEPDRAG